VAPANRSGILARRAPNDALAGLGQGPSVALLDRLRGCVDRGRGRRCLVRGVGCFLTSICGAPTFALRRVRRSFRGGGNEAQARARVGDQESAPGGALERLRAEILRNCSVTVAPKYTVARKRAL